MFEVILSGATSVFSALTALYWISLIVGGGLLVISAVAGSHADAHVHADIGGDMSLDAHVDADFSPDAHVNADVSGHPGDMDAGHASATSLASWFSLRFMVFFLAVFGLVGVVLTHLTAARGGAVLGAALVGGFVIGQGVHQLFRKLQRSSGDSAPHARDYVDKPARVTVMINAPRKGEVALQVGRGERFVPAVSKRADMSFTIGDRVVVVAYRGGIAEVVSHEEYEFLKGNNAGGDR